MERAQLRSIIAGCLFASTLPAFAAFTVDTAADADVDGDGACSLREAILAVNAQTNYHECTSTNTGESTLRFAIGPDAGERHVIELASALPPVTHQIDIDATTQAGTGCAPVPDVRVQVANPANLPVDGLVLDLGSDYSAVRGLAFSGFAAAERAGIRIASSDSEIACVVSGMDASGTVAQPNYYGIYIDGQGSVIGVASADEWLPNLFSGNTIANVLVFANGGGSVIAGNYVGVDASGSASLPSSFGIYTLGASDVRIGYGDASAPAERQRNVIGIAAPAGTTAVALQLDHAADNVVAGNYIGVGADGQTLLPIGTGIGVSVFQSSYALVGCDGLSAGSECGNVIANPDGPAAENFDGSMLTAFVGNRIGTAADATPFTGSPIAVGIVLAGADALVARNLITSGGSGQGVRLAPNAANTTAAFLNQATAGRTGALLDSSENCLEGNGGGGVAVSTGGNPTLVSTGFAGNWWGAADGPAPGGSGDAVASNVIYQPYLSAMAAACGSGGGTSASAGADVFRSGFEMTL